MTQGEIIFYIYCLVGLLLGYMVYRKCLKEDGPEQRELQRRLDVSRRTVGLIAWVIAFFIWPAGLVLWAIGAVKSDPEVRK